MAASKALVRAGAQGYDELTLSSDESVVAPEDKAMGARAGFLFTVLGIASCLFTAGAANAREVEARPWLVLEGETFTLYSNVSPKQSERLFRDLQLYQFVFHIITNTRPAKPSVPVYFHAFDRPTDAKRLGKPLLSSAYSRVARNAYHAVYLGGRKHLSYDLKAPYAGHLFRTHADGDYPLWYEIGLNEYLASITQRNAVFRVGGSERARYLWNGFSLRLEDVLDPKNAHLGDDHIWSFRFQSWALYHYLNHGNKDARENFSAHLPNYLHKRAVINNEVAAFEQELGIPTAGLQGKMKSFYSQGKHRIPTLGSQEWVKDDAIPEPRTLTRAEAALVLGRLARAMEQGQEASRLFAVAATDAAPMDEAEISCARARLDLKSSGEQIARIEQALEIHPANPACLIDHAEALLEAASQETSPARITEHAAKIQQSANTLALHDPQNAAAFVTFGRSFLLPGQDRSRAIESLVHARNLVRDDMQTRVYLAEAYRATGECERAHVELRLVLGWRDYTTAPSGTAAAAAQMLDELNSTCPRAHPRNARSASGTMIAAASRSAIQSR